MSEGGREQDKGARKPAREGEAEIKARAAVAARLRWATSLVTTSIAAVGGAAVLVAAFTKLSPLGQVLIGIGALVLVILLVAGASVAVRYLKLLKALGGTKLGIWSVGGVLVIALGAGTAIGLLISPSSSSNAGSSHGGEIVVPTLTPTPTPSAASSCPESLTITSPKSGTKIVGSTGVTLGITACGLTSGEAGWLLDYQDGTYGLDNGGAVVTQNGSTSFADTPVGDPGDVDADVKLTLVLANATCGQALAALAALGQDAAPATLPPSCKIADQIDVVETY